MEGVKIFKSGDCAFSSRNCVKVSCKLSGEGIDDETNQYALVPGVMLFRKLTQHGLDEMGSSRQKFFDVTPLIRKKLFLKGEVRYVSEYYKLAFVGVSASYVDHAEAKKHPESRICQVSVKGVVCINYPRSLLAGVPIGTAVSIATESMGMHDKQMPSPKKNRMYPTLTPCPNKNTEKNAIGVVVDHPREGSSENWIKLQLL